MGRESTCTTLMLCVLFLVIVHAVNPFNLLPSSTGAGVDFVCDILCVNVCERSPFSIAMVACDGQISSSLDLLTFEVGRDKVRERDREGEPCECSLNWTCFSSRLAYSILFSFLAGTVSLFIRHYGHDKVHFIYFHCGVILWFSCRYC